jgi:hypothetical protein
MHRNKLLGFLISAHDAEKRDPKVDLAGGIMPTFSLLADPRRYMPIARVRGPCQQHEQILWCSGGAEPKSVLTDFITKQFGLSECDIRIHTRRDKISPDVWIFRYSVGHAINYVFETEDNRQFGYTFGLRVDFGTIHDFLARYHFFCDEADLCCTQPRPRLPFFRIRQTPGPSKIPVLFRFSSDIGSDRAPFRLYFAPDDQLQVAIDRFAAAFSTNRCFILLRSQSGRKLDPSARIADQRPHEPISVKPVSDVIFYGLEKSQDLLHLTLPPPATVAQFLAKQDEHYMAGSRLFWKSRKFLHESDNLALRDTSKEGRQELLKFHPLYPAVIVGGKQTALTPEVPWSALMTSGHLTRYRDRPRQFRVHAPDGVKFINEATDPLPWHFRNYPIEIVIPEFEDNFRFSLPDGTPQTIPMKSTMTFADLAKRLTLPDVHVQQIIFLTDMRICDPTDLVLEYKPPLACVIAGREYDFPVEIPELWSGVIRVDLVANGEFILKQISQRFHRDRLQLMYEERIVCPNHFLAPILFERLGHAFRVVIPDRFEFSVRLRHRIFPFSLVSSEMGLDLRTVLNQWFLFDESGFRVLRESGEIVDDTKCVKELLVDSTPRFEIECSRGVRQKLVLGFAEEIVFDLDDTAGFMRSQFSESVHFYQGDAEVLRWDTDLLRRVERGKSIWVEPASATRRVDFGKSVRVPNERSVNVLLPREEELRSFTFSNETPLATVLSEVKALVPASSDSSGLRAIDSGEIVDLHLTVSRLPVPIDLEFIELIELSVTDVSGESRAISVAGSDTVSSLGRRFEGFLVTPFEMEVPGEMAFSDVSVRYGRLFRLAQSVRAVAVVLLDGTATTVRMASDASVLHLRDALAVRCFVGSSQLSLEMYGTELDDGARLEDVEDVECPIACVWVKKPRGGGVGFELPENYEQQLLELIENSRMDRRTVVRCFAYHQYQYDAALADLTAHP